MNKNDLVTQVAKETGLTRADTTNAVDSVFRAISSSLQQNEEVRLVGFGTFSVTKRNAQEGRNPRTGETIRIPARRVPKFKAGKALRESVAA